MGIYDTELLNIITPEYYDIEADTDEKKAFFLYNTFINEYGYILETRALEFGIKEWFQGLPGAVSDIKFYNYDIIDWGKYTGLLKNDATEQDEDRLLEKYWFELGKAAKRLFAKHKINKKIILDKKRNG